MNTKSLRLLALLLLAVSLGLAACGGGDDGSSGASDTTATTTMEMDHGSGVSVASPSADLRATLDRLLAEHAMLAQFATQKGLKGEPDFKAIAGALDQNSVELSEAIASVYGADAGKKFLDGKLLWRDHINFFVDYTTGVAKKDKAGQRKSVGNLRAYIEAFSGFLADATGLPQGALRSAITEHVMQLKGQLDQYNAGKYAASYGTLRTAYDHMTMTGDTLAGGIVTQSPDKFQG